MNSKTLPVGLPDYTAEFTIDWRGMCALAVVMIIPALTLTFIIQKHPFRPHLRRGQRIQIMAPVSLKKLVKRYGALEVVHGIDPK